MPIYPGRRPKTWRVTIYWGKQLEWIVEGKYKDAKRFEDLKRVELRAQTAPIARAECKFVDFCVGHYRPHAELHLGASTWNKCRRYQLEALGEFFGNVRLSEIGPLIEGYKLASKARGIKASVINHDLQVLGTVLRYAKSLGKLEVVPKIEKLSVPRRRVQAWRMVEVRALFAAAQQDMPWLVPLIHFLLETGCRKGELVAADWSWIDWERRMLRIPVTETWHPKDKDERDVPLSVSLLEALRPMQPKDGAIFRCRYGTRYARFPDREFKMVVEAAGLKGGPHTTRHTYASHFLQARPDLMLLAQVMGHSQTRITELYAHFLPEHLEKARDAVNLAPPSSLWPEALAKRPRSA